MFSMPYQSGCDNRDDISAGDMYSFVQNHDQRYFNGEKVAGR